MTLDEPLEESLINNNDFINALLAKLKAGADDNGVYTKKNVDDELAKKADTAALTNKADKSYVDTELRKKANSVNLAAKANTADVYTKKNVDDELAKKADTATLTNKADKNYVDTELRKKADTSALDSKANTTDVYTKTDADTAFVKATELKTKVAEKAVVDSITASSDFTDKVYTKTAADTAFVKTADLKTKAAEKDVVEAIFDAKDGNDKISETKIGATFAKKTDLNNKVNVLGDNATEAGVNAMLGKLTGDNVVVKINASNLTDAANQKAFAEAILPAKNGNKLVLVEKLGEFLGSKETAPYDGNNNQTAKVFLAEKGLKPTPQEVATELMKNPDFAQAATIEADANDKGFQGAVRGVMSQPYFDIQTDDSTPISMVW